MVSIRPHADIGTSAFNAGFWQSTAVQDSLQALSGQLTAPFECRHSSKTGEKLSLPYLRTSQTTNSLNRFVARPHSWSHGAESGPFKKHPLGSE